MSSTNYWALKIGDRDANGFVIKDIIGATRGIIVYLAAPENTGSEQSKVRLSVDTGPDDMTVHEARVFEHYHPLKSWIEGLYANNDAQREFFLRQLGHCLFHALCAKAATDVSLYFKDIHDKLSVKMHDVGRVTYLAAGCACAIALAAAGFWIAAVRHGQAQHAPLWLLGFPFGALGALISVFIRSRTLKLIPHSASALAGVNGMMRILMGSLFGFLVVIAVRGDLVFGSFAQDRFAMMMICTLAGMSERFVPDLLSQLGAKTDDEKPA
jgi:hypothetical protein